MQPAEIPENEIARLDRLHQYRILDTPSEEAFDRITRIVAMVLDMPIVLVSLVDGDRQWFKSRQGLEATETPRNLAFCAHAILDDEIFEVEDALNDPRFAENPLVTESPSIRFYAGAPLEAPDGSKLGTLCAIDQKPRKLTPAQRQVLHDLSQVVIDEMELRIALQTSATNAAESVRQQHLKDEFVTTVTHELRTPLTSIRGSLGLLDSGALGELPEKVASVITIANRNVEQLMSLVNDLLDFQKLEMDGMDFEFDTVDPAALLVEICENLQGYALENGVELVSDGEAPAIVGDRERLGQVLNNIISNAIKFSPKGGTVTAELSVAGNNLQFGISDRGAGIPTHFHSQIFEKFSQASGESKIKGTGLGLAISRAIIDAHQGRIRFDTEVGKGTTFYVEVPLQRTTLPQ